MPPFSRADPECDPTYGRIAKNKADLFWLEFENLKKEGFFTPEFKDLITNMLQLDPKNRLNMAEIIGHPWMRGETATSEAVKYEFLQRQQMIQHQKQ